VISVGLPVYNGEAYLEQSIQALLAQTYSDFELLISDNASTDATAAIARAFEERDPRVRLLRSERNQGAVENYLMTLRASKRPFFKWAAHDDLCRPTFLEKCLAALHAAPEAVVAFPRAQVIDAEGRFVKDVPARPNICAADPATRLAEIADLNSDVHPIFGLMRRSALEGCPPHGKYAGADRVLLAELLLRGPFVEVPEPLFLFRKHPAQYSSRPVSSHYKSAFWTGIESDWPQMANWQRLRGLSLAVSNSRLTASERSACRAALARWVGAHWKRLAYDGSVMAQFAVQRAVQRARPNSESSTRTEDDVPEG
jgi:glycosyltransferase involved in cell wall biosynthesis